MEAYVQVESCPEKPQVRKSNPKEEDDYDDDLEDDDLDVVRFDDYQAPQFLQMRSVAKKHPKTWVHYIAVEEEDWDYAPSVIAPNDRYPPKVVPLILRIVLSPFNPNRAHWAFGNGILVWSCLCLFNRLPHGAPVAVEPHVLAQQILL